MYYPLEPATEFPVVVKSNALIQKSRFKLSAQQHKIILYLIGKIRMEDEDFKLYDFKISDFCAACGLDNENWGSYTQIKTAIKSLSDQSLWITLEDGRQTLVRWIEKPYIDPKNGRIQIKFDADMKPFLLQLKENFTKYELFWTLHFQSKYSIRLYEIIKSIHYHEESPIIKEYTLDALRALLSAETYTTYSSFRQKVLDPATTEITQQSDKNLLYEPIKTKNTVTGIRLIVSSKSTVDTWMIRSDILESK